jgi:hypothetical protein
VSKLHEKMGHSYTFHEYHFEFLPKNSYIFITHLHRGFPGSWFDGCDTHVGYVPGGNDSFTSIYLCVCTPAFPLAEGLLMRRQNQMVV